MGLFTGVMSVQYTLLWLLPCILRRCYLMMDINTFVSHILWRAYTALVGGILLGVLIPSLAAPLKLFRLTVPYAW